MYPIISRVSFVIRFLICYRTIEQYPIYANEMIGWIIGQILSIYTVLWLISYVITGYISSRKGYNTSIEKSLIYFVVYLVLVGITYLILLGLTMFNILPI